MELREITDELFERVFNEAYPVGHSVGYRTGTTEPCTAQDAPQIWEGLIAAAPPDSRIFVCVESGQTIFTHAWEITTADELAQIITETRQLGSYNLLYFYALAKG